MKQKVKKLIVEIGVGILVMIPIYISASTINNVEMERVYDNKIKEIEDLGNKRVTGHYIAEMDGKHEYPELIVAVAEYAKDGSFSDYPFYIFTIKDGKMVQLKNETDVTSGDDMGTQITRYIVTNKNGDSLIKEVTVDGPFLDCDNNGKYKTYVTTTVRYLNYVSNKGLTKYLEKVSYMIYDNDKFDTSGKGVYKLVRISCNNKEIKESQYKKLLAEYK